MAEEQAVFGGEPSAHYYSRDFFRADSGMLAALHVLAALAETDGTASELLAGHDPYPSSGEINSVVPDPAAALDRVWEHTEMRVDAVAEERDGITDDFWTLQWTSVHRRCIHHS